MVNISSDKSSLASDLDNNLFALNQLVLYTKGNIKELGNIIGNSTKGKGMWPLDKINIKGGQELQVESMHLSQPSEDTMNEAVQNNQRPQL